MPSEARLTDPQEFIDAMYLDDMTEAESIVFLQLRYS